MKQGAGLIAIGVAIGIVLALFITRLMASMLFGITPSDLPTFLSVTALLFAVALAACYIPARRATQVDPMQTLRYE
ncbi:MAG: ABC transporter permease, partial [Candidatus Acidiferrum sp.]